MGVNLEDLAALRVDYIWLSAERSAEHFCSTVLAYQNAQGKPLGDAIADLRIVMHDILNNLNGGDYPEGATDEDKWIFSDRYAEYLRERIEELEEIEVDFASTAHQQPKKADVAEIFAARKRRIGFAPD